MSISGITTTVDGLTLRKQRNPFVLLFKPCLYPWLTQLSLVSACSQVVELSSLQAGKGSRKDPSTSCYYGNTAALLGTMLVTAAILSSNSFHSFPLNPAWERAQAKGRDTNSPPSAEGAALPTAHSHPDSHPNLLLSVEPFPLPVALFYFHYLSAGKI